MPKSKKVKKTLNTSSSSPNPKSEMEEEEPSDPSQDIPLSSPRRKTKKKQISKKKLSIINDKLLLLTNSLKIETSRPSDETLTAVDEHEALFRSLGLWDFAHLDLDPSPRRDLIVELLARFDPGDRCSYVLDARVNVSRADLARALALPLKKDRVQAEGPAEPVEAAAQAVLLRFIEEGMVFLEDAAEVPAEVVQVQQMVREGRAASVDWAALMWAMVEKEMVSVLGTGVCYYASHLQCLIKFQKPKLLEKEEEVPVSVPEEEVPEEEVPVSVQEESVPKEEVPVSVPDEEMEVEEEENADSSLGVDDGFELASKFPTIEPLNPMNQMQATGEFSLYQSNPEFLGMEKEMNRSNMLDPASESPGFFPNGHNITDGELANGEDGNVHGFSDRNEHDMFQSNEPCERTESVLAFDDCVGAIQNLLGNKRRILVERERAIREEHMRAQYLNSLIQQRDEDLQSLERKRVQVQQKMQIDSIRMEHELRTLSNVIYSYKKNLKATRNAFAEYKSKFNENTPPVLNDSDVKIESGVPCTKESEKTCVAKEVELYQVVSGMINDFEKGWQIKFDEWGSKFSEGGIRFVNLKEEVDSLKGWIAEDKDQKCERGTKRKR